MARVVERKRMDLGYIGLLAMDVTSSIPDRCITIKEDNGDGYDTSFRIEISNPLARNRPETFAYLDDEAIDDLIASLMYLKARRLERGTGQQ